MDRPRIVVADEYEALADACRHLLEPDFEVVATVHSGADALAAVREHEPDVLVVQLSIAGVNGVQLIRQVLGSGSTIRIVMLSLHRHPAVIQQVVEAGALGYVQKTRLARDLLPAVRAALAEESFVSSTP